MNNSRVILLPIAFNQTHAAAKKGLAVEIKLKYSDTAKSHPENYKKVRLNIASKTFEEYIDLKKLPSTIKITGLDNPVNQKFTVCLNNPTTDDGECSNAVNRLVKAPEVKS